MRLAAALLTAVLLAACGGAPETTGADPEAVGSTMPEEPTGSPTESPKPERSPGKDDPQGTEIVVRSSAFGPMLFDARGQAIYLFDVETSDEPRCYADCAVAWPPVLTRGDPVAGADVRPGLLGTTQRRDGSSQVTYGGHPLYFYAHEAPGEVECHDVFLNGGSWYVVRPDGERAA